MTTPKITLYAYTFRSRAERIIWTLNELQLDYTLIRLDLSKPEDPQLTEFARLNPNRKIPVLVHDGQVYTESLAIAEYLDSLNPDISLLPSSPAENYRLRHIIHYGVSEIEAYLWLGRQAAHVRQRYSWPEGTYDTAIGHVRRNLKYVYGFLGDNRFAVGDHFTLADIYLSHILAWSRGYDIELPDNIRTYLHRMEQRSAFPDKTAPKRG